MTAAVLVAGIILTGLMVVLERRPRTDLELRIFPTTPFMFLGVVISILALVHLLNLFGIHTGRN